MTWRGRCSLGRTDGVGTSIQPDRNTPAYLNHRQSPTSQHHQTTLPEPCPLARFTKIEIDAQELAHSLGQEPNGQALRCFRCLHPCEGFSGRDAAGTELPSGPIPDEVDRSVDTDIMSASQGS